MSRKPNTITFLPIIRSVLETGVGFKEFYFRSNMDYCEFIDEYTPNSGTRKELCLAEKFQDKDCKQLIIKFSDGTNYFGSIAIDEKKLPIAAEILNGELKFSNEVLTVGLVKLGDLYFENKYSITIFLRYRAIPEVDGTYGKAIIIVEPHHSKKEWYKWFEE